MCGIVGAISKRNVAPILLEGLKRLEYRGYDSAGLSITDSSNQIKRLRALGKVSQLEADLHESPLKGNCGIAHTRWATHGAPAEKNAHPHMSGNDIAVVHNGIIENHNKLRTELTAQGYVFSSQTDTEIAAHLIHYYLKQEGDFLKALQLSAEKMRGAFALGVMSQEYPHQIGLVKRGSPLVIGIGLEEMFIASDQLALLPFARKFIYLEEGDVGIITQDSYALYDNEGVEVERAVINSDLTLETVHKGEFRHFMQKEIFEQPEVVCQVIEGRLGEEGISPEIFGEKAPALFKQTKAIQIVACGTSYHAGLVARYWIENIVGIPCQVEIASEFRYRQVVVLPGTLFISVSQSGETADLLAALRKAKKMDYIATLALCNMPSSSLVRESDLVFMTRAGVEIGVASTKAFISQLVAFLMLTQALTFKANKKVIRAIKQLPTLCENILKLDKTIKKLAHDFHDKNHAIFLGRGEHYPIALEGALKLKEISYIHAEGYPAGELKHGPLALIDHEMPVIAIAPNDEMLEKLKSNLEEVHARGGILYIFTDEKISFEGEDEVHVVKLPTVSKIVSPIAYTIPLQLLAYHVAVLKGTDVDQPRNLAKSVTVE